MHPVPVVLEVSRGMLQLTAMWAENLEGEVCWINLLDGRRLSGTVIAWYEVPTFDKGD